MDLQPSEIRSWIEKHINFKSWDNWQGKGHCPFHDDKNPSFSFNAEKGGWMCFAGCGQGGIKDLADRLKIESPLKNKSKSSGMSMKSETVYPYRDENGNLLFEVVRFNKPDGTKGRSFQASRSPG